MKYVQKTLAILLFGLGVAAPLSACDPVSVNGSATYDVTELKCEHVHLDAQKKCPKIRRIGADLEILVNLVSQKVKITITRNDGNWGTDSFILDGCSVVDIKNWECRNNGPIVDTYAMERGHFYRTLVGGDSPNYYTSSVSGWIRNAMRLGYISPEMAQSLD